MSTIMAADPRFLPNIKEFVEVLSAGSYSQENLISLRKYRLATAVDNGPGKVGS